MRRLLTCISLTAVLLATAANAGHHKHGHKHEDKHKHEHEHKHEEKRELGAHEHGHGSLNIATEGKLILLELHAPGADIFGFETKAETDEQKSIQKKAIADLSDPLTLFDLGSAAGCKKENAKVEIEAEGEHNEVHAEYSVHCKNPKKIKSINFKYFSRFSGAKELDVKVIGSKGQQSFEVERSKAVLDLGGSL